MFVWLIPIREATTLATVKALRDSVLCIFSPRSPRFR
jgi:hypothetical protein